MPSPRETVFVWNRRVHYYLGLYFLFFTWLFAFTGLLLNHPRWEFAQFWPNRVQTVADHAIQPLAAGSDVERARALMLQLGISGEIQWPAQSPPPGSLAFQVTRPGLVLDVKANLDERRASVQRTQLNAWGVLHVLHTFTGVPAADPRHARDWIMTTIWALSMDAVAVGLAVMVLSSYIMWYRLRTKRIGGLAALVLGYLACGMFLWVLR